MGLIRDEVYAKYSTSLPRRTKPVSFYTKAPEDQDPNDTVQILDSETSPSYSTLCPLSRSLQTVPVRTDSCRHLETFDLHSCLMSETFMENCHRYTEDRLDVPVCCPVCKAEDKLHVDGLIETFLKLNPTAQRFNITDTGNIELCNEGESDAANETINLVSPNPVTLDDTMAASAAWTPVELDSRSCLTLEQVLRAFLAPISEYHAWAIIHQTVQCLLRVLDTTDIATSKYMAVSSRDIVIHKEGFIHPDTFLFPGLDRKEITSELSVMDELGMVVYEALDYTMPDEVQRKLGKNLEMMLETMTDVDSGDEGDEGIEDCELGRDLMRKIVELCRKNVEVESEAGEHYSGVCRALVVEALEISSFMSKVDGSHHVPPRKSAGSMDRILTSSVSVSRERRLIQPDPDWLSSIPFQNCRNFSYPPTFSQSSNSDVLVREGPTLRRRVSTVDLCSPTPII